MTPTEIDFLSKVPVNIYIAPEIPGGTGSDQYSNLVWVHTIKRLSLEALRACIPAIAYQLSRLLNEARRNTIINVVLPAYPMESYNSILRWIEDIIESECYKPYPIMTDMPLWHYRRVIQAVEKLRMDYLVNELNDRISQMLSFTDGDQFSLDMLDVLKFYQSVDHDDPLRTTMIAAMDHAKRTDSFSENFRKEYKEFLVRYPTCGLEPIEDDDLVYSIEIGDAAVQAESTTTNGN